MRFAFHRLALRLSPWVVCSTLLSAGLLAQGAANELGRPLLRVFTPGEYIGAYPCQAIAQDSAGVIYIANGAYLRAYDGTKWQMLNSLPVESAGIREFATTASGVVFAGGPGVVGFIRREGAEAAFVSLDDQLPAESRDISDIRHAVAIGDTVYFTDDQKLLIWRAGRFTAVPYAPEHNVHRARLHNVGDVLYVSASGQPLRRLVEDRLEAVVDDPLVRENRIVLAEAGPEPGALVLLTAERGFLQLDPTGRVMPFASEANRWLVGKRIYRALRLPDGSLVVGFSAVSGDGGMRFAADGTYLGPLDMTIGLVVKTIRNFFRDREGGLWIGMEMGTARMEWPAGVTQFDVSNGLGYGAVTDVVRHAGVLYAATTEGLFRLRRADATGQPARFELVLARPIFALAAHPDGLLALGGNELLVQSASGFVVAAPLTPGGRALLVSSRDPTRAWAGTIRGLHALRRNGDGWRDEGLLAGLTGPAQSLGESPDGALWVGAAGGAVFRAAESGVERFEQSAGRPDGRAGASIGAWRGETVVAFNHDPRPYRLDARRGKFSRWPGTEKLPLMVEENGGQLSRGDGRLWFGGAAGIYGLATEGEVRRLPHYVAASAGAVSRLYQETGDAGEVLWVGGDRGLLRVEVSRAFVPTQPFQTQLRAAGVHAGAQLATEHGPLTFAYVAPRYRLAGEVTYQSRLIGRERNWSAWEPARERSFAHLSPGRYRFEVRARDTDGIVSAPATLAFTVLSPWWRSWAAWIVYVAAGAGLLTGVVRLRTRALQQRAERLEGIVVQRTQELAQKNRELTRLHRLELDEKISAKLGEEKARLEVLRYQLNPHFLFNALATISGLAVREPKAARAVTRKLAEFCRLTLTRGRHEFVTLEEEFQMLESYLDVVRAGSERPPVVTFALDPAASRLTIPAFLLLPLVENASKYGRGTGREPLRITISAQTDVAGEGMTIEVANTGTWVDDFADRGHRPSTQIGLENIRQRLARIYPGAHEFATAVADGWVRARLRIPVGTGRAS